MILKDFIPAPDIREFVQLYRIVHFRFSKDTSVPFKAYPPRPEHCLAFYPFDREQIRYPASGKLLGNVPVVLYGQFSEVTHRYVGHDFLVFQIIFYPGALYRITGVPASLLTNEYLDATAVFGTVLQDVNEQLGLAGSYTAMLDIANQFVRKLAARQKRVRLPLDDAFALMMGKTQRYGIDQLAADACMSRRNLERVFFERTGVSPKTYERIIRFDKAFRLKNAYPQYSWLRIALECGFHDHQHLSKTYKDFTGLAPRAFHQIEDQAPERAFGLIEGYYE